MENKKNTKLIVCSWDSEQKDSLRKKYGITEENEVYAPCVYMDGKLEDLAGYDQIEVLNPDELTLKTVGMINSRGTTTELRYIDYIGIMDCTVIGVDEPCVAYIWTVDEMHRYTNGLICLKSDLESIMHAIEKYKKRAVIL